MTPRSLPLHPDAFAPESLVAIAPAMRGAPVGVVRKTFAIALHLTCLGLFGLVVVWPVASPMASGELAREFKPVLEALAAWAS